MLLRLVLLFAGFVSLSISNTRIVINPITKNELPKVTIYQHLQTIVSVFLLFNHNEVRSSLVVIDGKNQLISHSMYLLTYRTLPQEHGN